MRVMCTAKGEKDGEVLISRLQGLFSRVVTWTTCQAVGTIKPSLQPPPRRSNQHSTLCVVLWCVWCGVVCVDVVLTAALLCLLLELLVPDDTL
jgi:hypothetical protein